MSALITLEGIDAGYGSAQVLFDFSLEVHPGEVVSLMGRNGMGKTTTLKTIMGIVRPTSGRIDLFGRDATRLARHRIAQAGIGYVPEGRHIFPTLSVRENLIATAANHTGADDPWTIERAVELFPRLGERMNQMGATLSGGEQQMLAIARALMTNPQVLLLDEATEGLAPLVRQEIWDALNDNLRAQGQAILLVDQHPDAMIQLSDRIVIIEKGRTVWSGAAAALDAEREILHRYLGV